MPRHSPVCRKQRCPDAANTMPVEPMELTRPIDERDGIVIVCDMGVVACRMGKNVSVARA